MDFDHVQVKKFVCNLNFVLYIEHLIDIKMYPFGESSAPSNQLIIKRNEMPIERGRAVIDPDYEKKPENKLVLLQQRNKGLI